MVAAFRQKPRAWRSAQRPPRSGRTSAVGTGARSLPSQFAQLPGPLMCEGHTPRTAGFSLRVSPLVSTCVNTGISLSWPISKFENIFSNVNRVQNQISFSKRVISSMRYMLPQLWHAPKPKPKQARISHSRQTNTGSQPMHLPVSLLQGTPAGAHPRAEEAQSLLDRRAEDGRRGNCRGEKQELLELCVPQQSLSLLVCSLSFPLQ